MANQSNLTSVSSLVYNNRGVSRTTRQVKKNNLYIFSKGDGSGSNFYYLKITAGIIIGLGLLFLILYIVNKKFELNISFLSDEKKKKRN